MAFERIAYSLMLDWYMVPSEFDVVLLFVVGCWSCLGQTRWRGSVRALADEGRRWCGLAMWREFTVAISERVCVWERHILSMA